MKKTGLFFGTFNPVHVGHLIIANHMVEFTDLDEVWFVVTPHNPHKEKKSLLKDYHRFEMVYRATEDMADISPSNIEFDLPQPNYTAHTLVHLEEKYSDRDFALIMGEDNLRSFPKWKNHEAILAKNELYVYPRIKDDNTHPQPDLLSHEKVNPTDAPIMQISATYIRNCIKTGKRVEPIIPHKVWKYIDEMNFYR